MHEWFDCELLLPQPTYLQTPVQRWKNNGQGWIQDFPKGGANDGKGEWGVPPPTQSREAFAIIVRDKKLIDQILCHLEENQCQKFA